MAQPLDQWLLDMLVCAESKAPVVQEDAWLYSTDRATRRRYPILDGIPKMLIEESQVVTKEEFTRVMRKHGVSID